MKRIEKAIKNEEKFCEEPDELRDKVGSNVGKVIKELKTDKLNSLTVSNFFTNIFNQRGTSKYIDKTPRFEYHPV